jgi:putative heme-binding domain-containing protein
MARLLDRSTARNATALPLSRGSGRRAVLAARSAAKEQSNQPRAQTGGHGLRPWLIGAAALSILVTGVVPFAQQTGTTNPAANNPHIGNKDAIRAGMTIYRTRCADCHGLDAHGYRGPDLVAAIAGGLPDERLFQTIRKGIPGTEMPPAPDNSAADDDILLIIAYLKSVGSVPPTEKPVGNVENGARLFQAQCTGCHRINGKGGRLGPDLSRVGVSRSHTALVREIRTPAEWVPPQFETVTVVTKDGQRIRGTKKNEDVFSIQIMDTRERLLGFLKSDLQDVVYEKGSLMPAFPASRLNDSDLTDIVGYLATLRGTDTAR